MTKIVIFAQNYPPEKTGGASRLWDMTYHMQKAGAELTVVCPHPTFPFGNFTRISKRKMESDREGIHIVNLWVWQPQSDSPAVFEKLLYYLTYPFHATFWLLANYKKYDVIITSNPPLFVHIPGFVVRCLHKIKWIVEFRDLWVDASIDLGFLKEGSFNEKISRVFQTRCLKMADLIAVTTNEMGRRLVTDENLKDKLILLPNGVDPEVFKPVPFEEKVNQLIFAGNIGYAQDLEIVIRSLKIINQKHPIVLNLVGSGEIVELLHEVAQEEGVENLVLFTGLVEREEVPSLVAHAKLVVAPLKDFPALEYAAPIKTYEAMACGTPFVACGKGEIAELAEVSGAGVIAQNTPESFAETVIALLDNPEKMQEMAISGRAHVEEYYSRKEIALKLLKEAEKLL